MKRCRSYDGDRAGIVLDNDLHARADTGQKRGKIAERFSLGHVHNLLRDSKDYTAECCGTLPLDAPCDSSLHQFSEDRLERRDGDGSDAVAHRCLGLSPDGFLPSSRQKIVSVIGETANHKGRHSFVKDGFNQPCILGKPSVLINLFRAATGNFNRMFAHAGWLFFNFNEYLAKEFYVACQFVPFPNAVKRS
jgi:hypothetical protein